MKKTLILFSIIFVLCLCGCGKKNQDNNTHENSGKLTTTLENLKYKSEMIEVKSNTNYLKLDYIDPDLDTFDLKTVMYSIDDNRVLGEIQFPNDLYSTGILDNGFYAIALNKKQVIMYNQDCKEIFNKKYEELGDSWSFADVSPDGKYLVYGAAYTTDVFIYDLTTDKQTKVGNFKDYIASIGFVGNNLYLKDGNNSLIKIDTIHKTMDFVYDEQYLEYINPFYGIDQKENNFYVVPIEKEDSPFYVFFESLDEIPIYANDFGFITHSIYENKNILRVYNLRNMYTFTIEITDNLQKISNIGNDKILIVTKNADNEYKFSEHSVVSNNASPIQKNTTDLINNDIEQKEYEVSVPDLEDKTEIASKYIYNVPIISQFPEYPTGCESVSATIALQYAGADITVDEFVDNYLEKSNHFYYSNGKNYGPDPYETFVGNPRSKPSFGCMAPVIEKAITKYYGSSSSVINATGKTMEELTKEYIDKGYPVIVWVSINMIDTYPTSSWYLQNGEKYTWIANEHCMVLIGYDDNNYYFVDPYKGKEVMYKKAITEKRYSELGMQAIVII